MQFRFVLLACVLAATSSGPVHADAMDRLKAERLEAIRNAIAHLRTQSQKLERPGSLKDFRANLHVHSSWSHDSRGTVEEIAAAARAAGTHVLMFTEHPTDKYDYFKDGHRGLRDGILLIPGAETKGFLAFPKQSLRGLNTGTPQEYADLVRRGDGLIFLSHLEERMDWTIRGLTGTEIYNTHANFKDEKRLQGALRNPLWLFGAVDLFRKYPQEAFSALHAYPAGYLKRWDELGATTPHTGIAANDAHQNVGLRVRLLDKDQARVEDALGKKLIDLPVETLAFLQEQAKGKKSGDVIFNLQLDPYEVSLKHVGTHLLMPRLGETEVWEALAQGRAYVSFDWLADPTGFDFAAVAPKHRHEMGAKIAWEKDLKLRAQAPLSVTWKLVRDGKKIAEQPGRSLDYVVKEPGNYRVEAWLDVAGEAMIWILSNPIYIKKGPPAMAKSFVTVPDTVSPQARAYLEALPDPATQPDWPTADDNAGWKRMWQAGEAASEPKVQATLKRYQPVIVERKLGGVPVLDIRPRGWKDDGKVLVHAHGGAYTMFSARSRLTSSVPAADATGLRVTSIDYTVAPLGKWPKATDEVLAVIAALQKEGYSLKDIAVYGESAGGGLVAGAVLKMRDQGLGMPAVVVLWSPWADLTDRGDTAITLKNVDPAHRYDKQLKPSADAYADSRDQKHPYASPIYSDYTKGFPPTLIQGGTREIFLSHFVRLYRAIDDAGGTAMLDLYEGMPHIFQVRPELADAPETKTALRKMAAFIKKHLGR